MDRTEQTEILAETENLLAWRSLALASLAPSGEALLRKSLDLPSAVSGSVG